MAVVALQMTEGIKNSVVLCSGGLWTAAVLTECALACMYLVYKCLHYCFGVFCGCITLRVKAAQKCFARAGHIVHIFTTTRLFQFPEAQSLLHPYFHQ